MRAVRPKPSPAVLPPGFAAGVSEVSRFSCMKFLGVSGVFDYAGLNQRLAISPLFMRTLQLRRRPDCIFSELDSPAHLYPCLRFVAHLAVRQRKTRGRVVC